MLLEASKLDELENKKIKGGNIIESTQGTFMTIPAHLVFEPGKADLTNDYAPGFIKRLAKLLKHFQAIQKSMLKVMQKKAKLENLNIKTL